jgi:hypothetical protein
MRRWSAFTMGLVAAASLLLRATAGCSTSNNLAGSPDSGEDATGNDASAGSDGGDGGFPPHPCNAGCLCYSVDACPTGCYPSVTEEADGSGSEPFARTASCNALRVGSPGPSARRPTTAPASTLPARQSTSPTTPPPTSMGVPTEHSAASPGTSQSTPRAMAAHRVDRAPQTPTATRGSSVSSRSATARPRGSACRLPRSGPSALTRSHTADATGQPSTGCAGHRTPTDRRQAQTRLRPAATLTRETRAASRARPGFLAWIAERTLTKAAPPR